jgi:hypothetical protein
MRHAEADAARHGMRRCELLATLSGVPLYRRLGYLPCGARELRLADGTPFPVVEMTKPLGLVPARAA